MRKSARAIASLLIVLSAIVPFGAVQTAYGHDGDKPPCVQSSSSSQTSNCNPDNGNPGGNPNNGNPSNDRRCPQTSSNNNGANCGRLQVRSLKPNSGPANQRVPVELLGQNFQPGMRAFLFRYVPMRDREDWEEHDGDLRPKTSQHEDNGRKDNPNWPRPDIVKIELQNVQVVTEHRATAIVPVITPGHYSLYVLPEFGMGDLLTPAYRALDEAPHIEDVHPGAAPNDAPAPVLITGFNFQSGLTVTLTYTRSINPEWGPEPLSNTASVTGTITGTVVLSDGLKVAPNAIQALVPAGLTPGLWSLTITNPDGKSDTFRPGFLVLPARADDLIAKEIFTDPRAVHEGDTVRLGLTVKRTGGSAPLTNVLVRFYRGLPEDGAVISDTIVSSIGPNAETRASIRWDTTGLTGTVPVSAVIDPSGVISEATKVNNVEFRQIRLLLPDGGNEQSPQISGFSINNGATQTLTPAVTISVTAQSISSTINSMWIGERVFFSGGKEWVHVSNTGWITFSSQFTYTLSPYAGAHNLAIWVSDNDGNISQPATAWINYVPVSDTIRQGQRKIFRLNLRAGDILSATLTSLSGDADLYLWGPGGRLAYSNQNAGVVDSITYAALTTGRYWLEVAGWTDAAYSLVYTTTAGNGFTSQSVTPQQANPGKTPFSEAPNTGVEDPSNEFTAIPADTRAPSGEGTGGLYIPISGINMLG